MVNQSACLSFLTLSRAAAPVGGKYSPGEIDAVAIIFRENIDEAYRVSKLDVTLKKI